MGANDGAGDAPLTFAQVELGGLLVGIAAEHVVRALPRPAGLARLPSSHDAIEGVFSHDGAAVPLVDLRRWMHDAPAREGAAPHAMVLQAGGRLVGLAADAIRGLVRLPRARIRQVQHDDAPDALFHSVATLDDGVSLISLLDPLRLMTLARAWTQGGGDAAGEILAGGGSTGGHAATPLQALLRIGAATVAVPATQVGEVIKLPPVQVLDLGDSAVAGMLQWRGAHVPVLSAARALDLEGAADSQLLLVLADHGRAVALPVNEVLAVRSLPAAAIEPAAGIGLDGRGLFSGLVCLDDGTRVLMLDSGAVLDAYAAPGLAGDAAGRSGSTAGSDGFEAQAHIVFDIGVQWAVPMSVLHEIAPCPADFQPAPANERAVAGTCEWRGRPLPVLDLRAGDARTAAPQRMMVVRHEGRAAGLLVEDVVALLPAHSATATQFSVAGGGAVRMITVGQAPQRKSYRVIDLASLPFFAQAGEESATPLSA